MGKLAPIQIRNSLNTRWEMMILLDTMHFFNKQNVLDSLESARVIDNKLDTPAYWRRIYDWLFYQVPLKILLNNYWQDLFVC